MRLFTWVSLTLLVCGILAFYYLGQTLQIHCYRLEGRNVACASQIYWFDLVAVAEPQLFAPITHAVADFNCSSRPGESDSCTSAVILQNEAKQYRLETRFFNRASANKAADAINEFIAQNTIFIDIYPTDKINVALTSCIGVPFFFLGAIMLWAQLRESGVLPIFFE